MNRMRRIAGMGKTKVPSAVQKDKDESIVFFRELYKHEKDADVNLLEPMYSVEFDAIQGGHMSRPPSGRRDFLMPIAEKHGYDWLKTPPAASLYPSLEVEANSSKMKELPIPQPVKPSTSRFLGRPEGPKKTSPPTGSSPKKNLFRGAPSISNVDKRSAHTALPSRQQKPAPVTARATTPTSRNSARATTATSGNSAKKQSYRCHVIQGSSANATEPMESPEEVPYKAPKNLLTTGSVFVRRGVPPTTTAKGRSGGPATTKEELSGQGTEPMESPEEVPYKAPKNLFTTGSVFVRRGVPPTTTAKGRSGGSATTEEVSGQGGRLRPPAAATRGFKELQESRKKDLLAKGGRLRPPAAATRGFKELQESRKKDLLAKGKVVDGNDSEPACHDNNGHVSTDEAVRAKGVRSR